jgi:hypothetical protein
MPRDRRPLSAAALLDAWETGMAQHPLGRALTLLQLAEPEQSLDTLALLSIGELNRRLLALRERLIGPRFEAVASCPRCGERLELSLTAQQLRASAPNGTSEPIDVVHNGYSVRVRLPNTADLLDVIDATSAEQAQARVLARCLLSVRHGDTELPPETVLPDAVIAAVQARMAQADPMGDLQLALNCPACGHGWTMALDLAMYLWEEVAERAKRLLRETHTLARAYGWREADILAMSEQRRQWYLDLIANA